MSLVPATANDPTHAASVELLVNGEARVWLGPGAIIGRTAAATLRIDDPGISEAHALVSLRGVTLKLLSLRGRFIVDGQRQTEVVLVPHLVIELAPAVTLEVTRVELPPRVAALRIDDGVVLVPPPVASFQAPSGDLVAGLAAQALAVLWASDDGFRMRREGLSDLSLRPGDVFELGAHRFEVTTLPLAMAGTQATEADPRFAAPLELVVRFDTVHVYRGDQVVAVDGMPGRIMSELALMGAPAEWRVVAREVWPEEADPRRLRMNWDAAMARLRQRLRDAGVRIDLVRSLGAGLIELYLGPSDRIRDES